MLATILEMKDEDFDFAIDLNVKSMIRTIRAVLPGMLERGDGAIVNMASVAGSMKGVPNRFAYGVTKAAVVGLTKAVAADYVARGIRCNCICPGTVESPSLDDRMRAQGDYETARAAFIARQPMGRLGTPEEIADLAVYLAGATYTTGQAYAIDGGWDDAAGLSMTRITGLRVFDLRFPTSQSLDGSDAMNPDPDYSAAYVILDTDADRLSGHGLTFTIGRGNDICCMAIEAMRHLVVGLELDWVRENPGRFWRHLTGDSQLRWIGPDKGAMHLAVGAVVNAVWDLWAKEAGKPVWRLVADMSPEEIVSIVDFRYLTDVLTPDEALAILRKVEAGKTERIATLEREGYACYTTSAGWLGYDDAKLRRLCQEAVDAGFNHVKMKVGRDLADDIRRLTIAREVIGPDRYLMIDANQVWEVGQAIDWLKELAFTKPFFIEEPTSPDDVAGHRKIREAIAPIKVATGEMCQNRIMFKQFIAEGAIDVVQIDSCRMGGLNEVLSVLLIAAKYGLPVWPHAGGVGLCEYVQHLSMIDYVAVSGTKEGRVIEYVDHLHEHFVEPCVIRNAAYMPPKLPGFSIEMDPASIAEYQHRPSPRI